MVTVACAVTGCAALRTRRGWCEKHYQRWKRHGDPEVITTRIRSQDLMLRFWAEAHRGGTAADLPCLIWPAARNAKGYGITNRNGQRLVSRAVWVEFYGSIPPEFLVCHHCDNPSCGRPGHLFLGTHAHNTADMVRKGRHVAPSGARNGRTKLTVADVQTIRTRVADGETVKAVATDIGVHASYVSRLARGIRRPQ